MERYYRVLLTRTGPESENKVLVQLQSRSLSTDYVNVLSTICHGFDRAQDIANEWQQTKARCTDSAYEIIIDTRSQH